MIGLLGGRFGEEKGGIDISEGETFVHMNVGGVFWVSWPFFTNPIPLSLIFDCHHATRRLPL